MYHGDLMLVITVSDVDIPPEVVHARTTRVVNHQSLERLLSLSKRASFGISLV